MMLIHLMILAQDDDELNNTEIVVDESHSNENSSASDLSNSEEPSDTEA